ncbi:MAG: hypothetical protein QOH57_318 [Mycobacterium sp.]|nr:hypothetical protein [Mycobacterium sp.]
MPVAALAGAVLGTVARYLSLVFWASSAQSFLTTLILTALACVLLGALRANDGGVSAVLTGFAGAVASVSIFAAVAVLSSPAWCAALAVSAPLSAAAGLGIGLLIAVARRSKAQPVVDRA